MAHCLARRAADALRAAVLVAGVSAFASAPSLDRDGERWVKRTLEKMTLDQRIGQMLVPAFESTYLPTDSDVFDNLARLVRDQHVGGFIVFGVSQPTPGVLLNTGYAGVTLGQPMAAASTFNRLQELARVPLLNAADFETGLGMRIAGATVFPRAMAFGATGDTRLVAEAARITALEGRAIGVHVNFAPVADVNNNQRNPVINTRSFGETPAHVSSMVASYVRGLQQHGMIATLKHFPGHGDTDVDSHLGLPVILHPRARLDEIELPPFRSGIEAGAGAVMTSHIAMPSLDPAPDTPATFSQPMVTGLLRRDLAFDGLIFTDSMEMQGVTRLRSAADAAVRAVDAGHDMLLDLPDTPAAFAAIKAAVQDGRIPASRIAISAERILRTKASLGLQKRKQVVLDDVPKQVGGRANRAVAQVVSERSITLLKDERNSVPLRLPPNASVLYLSVLDYPASWGIGAPSRILAPELRKRWPRLTAVELSDRSTASELDLVQATADRYDAIVAALFVRSASYGGRTDLAPGLARLLNDLARRTRGANTPFVSVMFGNPYAATLLPEVPAILLTYDYYDLAEGSATRAIVGEAPIAGRLPIALPGLYPIGHGLAREVARATAAR